MYDDAMDGMSALLLRRTKPSGLLYVGQLHGRSFRPAMEHLACFVGGMLALGAKSSTDFQSARAQRDWKHAKGIAYTCFNVRPGERERERVCVCVRERERERKIVWQNELCSDTRSVCCPPFPGRSLHFPFLSLSLSSPLQMYDRMPSGLSAEWASMGDGNVEITAPANAAYYILRPEAAETLFVLHQLTGHPIYREWGWKMFRAIEIHCKTKWGYGNYPDVRDANRQPDNRAETFFLAETMKYLFLLQEPEGEGVGGVPLDKYVFNTEAHPMSIWDDSKSNFGK